MNPHILVVDDDSTNLEIICEYLEDSNYQLSTADDGDIAWEKLDAEPEKYDIILLDRMMPNMDGMEVLKLIKRHPQLKNCPVIMQTARADKDDVLEGIKGGAFYYLTKPFDEDLLFSVVKSAIVDSARYKSLARELSENQCLPPLMDAGQFRFQKLDEAYTLASFIAQACPEPDTVVIGLSELLVNAIEHGNLGISYEEKSSLNMDGKWEEEVTRLVDLEQNQNKFAEVVFHRNGNNVEIKITDQGTGFDWQNYVDISAERALDNHGRGIVVAKEISFSKVEYIGNGNQVVASIVA